MKFWKYTFITVFAFLGITMTVLYSSCVQDSCTELKCQNEGTCADGFCKCPTGYSGAECEIKIMDKFTGTYIGTTDCNQSVYGVLPTIFDTVDIYRKAEPLSVMVVRRRHDPWSDTLFGVINDPYIVIDSFAKDNFKRVVNITLNSQGLTLKEEETTIVDTATYHNNCTFFGKLYLH